MDYVFNGLNQFLVCPLSTPANFCVDPKKLSIFNNEITFGIYNVLISILIFLPNGSSHPKCTTLEQFLDVPSVGSTSSSSLLTTHAGVGSTLQVSGRNCKLLVYLEVRDRIVD